jgi:hypothetical protein
LPADHVAHWYGMPTSRRAATQQAKVWLTSASHPFSPFSLAGSLEARAEDFPAQSDRRLLRQRGAGATTPLSGISRRARRHACAGWQSLGHLERITIGHKQAAIASGWFLDVRPLPRRARCMLRVALLRRFAHAVTRVTFAELSGCVAAIAALRRRRVAAHSRVACALPFCLRLLHACSGNALSRAKTMRCAGRAIIVGLLPRARRVSR